MKIMKFLIKAIQDIIKKDFFIIFGIAFFNHLPYGINRYFFGKYSKLPIFIKILKDFLSFSGFFILVFGIVLILYIFNKKIKDIILKLVYFISFMLFFIEVFLIFIFKSLISPTIVQILLETNKDEILEFLVTYINLKLLLLLIIVLLSCYFFKKLKFKINIFNKKYNILEYIIFLSIVIKLFSINSELHVFNIIRLYKSVKISYNNIKEYNKIFNNLDKNNISIILDNSKIKNIVLVIGESTTRNHMSLYDYPLETNPLLKKLEMTGNLYKFTNTISPHAHTIPVLKKLLTFYNYESLDKWYSYNNIVSIMNKANYETFWFSNQESSGIYGNVAVALGSKSNFILFNKLHDSSDSDIDGYYDEQIIDKSIEHLKKSSEKNFIIYHLLGTHADYKKRYPKNFDIFQNKNKVISQYDNAILYNDYVVNKIISNFQDKEAIIIYVSDHGEEVYDFRNFSGHAESNPSRYMVEIPFLIYVSNKFKENYPDIIKKIENSLDRPYMTDDLIHTILDISNIKTLEYDETRSIINERFNIFRKRIFSEKEYDIYWINQNK